MTTYDSFSKLAGTLSRQRLWQLRRRRDGRCIKCGRRLSAESRDFCTQHLAYSRESSLSRYYRVKQARQTHP